MIRESISNNPPPGFFSLEDAKKCRLAADSLCESGAVVLLVAPNSELSSFYLRHISRAIIDQREKGEGSIEIKKLLKNRDSILTSINKLLNRRAVERVCEASRERSEEIWLVESVNKATLPEVIFAAKTLRKLPGSGASLLILADSENSRGLKELLHRVKVLRYDFSIPDVCEVKDALKNTYADDLRSEILAVAGAMKRKSITEVLETDVSRETETKVSKRDKARARFFSDKEIRSLLRLQEQKKEVPSKKSGPEFENVVSTFSQIKKVGLGLALVALFLGLGALQIEMEPSATRLDKFEVSEVLSTSSADDQKSASIVSLNKNKFVMQSPAVAQNTARPNLGSVNDTQSDEEDLKRIFENKEPLSKEIIAETAVEKGERANSSSQYLVDHEGRNPSEPPSSGKSKKDTYFVQHAAFSQLEGAMVWKSNNASGISAEIFIKGNNPKRFVLLTGPYIEKERASNSIIQSSDAFVVPSRAIGELVYSVSGL